MSERRFRLAGPDGSAPPARWRRVHAAAPGLLLAERPGDRPVPRGRRQPQAAGPSPASTQAAPLPRLQGAGPRDRRFGPASRAAAHIWSCAWLWFAGTMQRDGAPRVALAAVGMLSSHVQDHSGMQEGSREQGAHGLLGIQGRVGSWGPVREWTNEEQDGAGGWKEPAGQGPGQADGLA